MNSFLKIFLITVSIFAIGLGFAQAASDDLFSGFAWSENIGWVSFNCTSDDSCDDMAYSYGVTFDEVSGKITGWAWSENIGWITFNRSEAGDPPEAPYSTTSDGIAYIDLDTDELSGWSRALSYGDGWDGWISLSGSSPNYGVTRNGQELEGYAWGGDVVGWLSFNCSNATSCASSDYAVETYGGDTSAPYSFISSPDSESWYSEETFNVQITDEETGSVQSGLDEDSCKYSIINMDGLVEESSTGYLDRDCNSTESITVEEGGNAGTCHIEGEDSCYVYVASKDMAGNWSTSTAPSYNYYNIDWTPPEVTKIYLNELGEEEPISVTEGVEYTLKSAVSDNLGVDACQLVINTVGQSNTVTIESGIASVNYQFTEPGDLYTNYMRCRDNAWNLNEGSTTTFFTVEPAEDPVITNLEISPGDCISSDECTDQFSCCTDFTTQSDCCTQFNLEAYDPDDYSLSYSWDFDGNGSIDSTSEDPSHHYSSPGTYTAQVVVTADEDSGSSTSTIDVVISNPTLSVDMSAIPSFALGTLEDVDLRDIVSGTMFGTINYKFDCTNDGSWEIDTTESSADYTATDTCDYNATGTYVAATEVGRGTASATDTVSISVAGSCTPGETMSCTSNQGCSHTITCGDSGSWPSCPTDTCTIGDTQGCGAGFIETCTASCEWGTCSEIGDCTEDSDCRCPVDSCSSGDYYDYPQYGTCVNYYCDIDTATTTDPCYPIITIDDDANCNFAPICNSLTPSPAIGVGPLSVTLSVDAIDDNGDIRNYSFDFGDGTTGESNLSYSDHTYAGPGVGEAEGSSVSYTATARAQDEVDNWSSTTTNCQATIEVTKNHTPTALIGCDASNCSPEGSCSPTGESIVYKGGNCSFSFLNNSTDDDSSNDDSNNHIATSSWSIYDESSADWWANPYVTYSGDVTTTMSSLNLPLGIAGLPTGRNYYVLLEVEDEKGATATATADFYVRDDVSAAFECSLVDPDATSTTWRSCDGLSVSEGERVYFRDLSEPSETAATTTNHAWTFTGGTPDQVTYTSRQNTSATFEQGVSNAGRVTLEVTDSLGRVNSVQKDLTVTIPLPEWQEIAPID